MRIKLSTFALVGLVALGGCAGGQSGRRPWKSRSSMPVPIVGKPARVSQQLKVNREIRAERNLAARTVVDGHITQ
jgi:hypothetical protein